MSTKKFPAFAPIGLMSLLTLSTALPSFAGEKDGGVPHPPMDPVVLKMMKASVSEQISAELERDDSLAKLNGILGQVTAAVPEANRGDFEISINSAAKNRIGRNYESKKAGNISIRQKELVELLKNSSLGRTSDAKVSFDPNTGDATINLASPSQSCERSFPHEVFHFIAPNGVEWERQKSSTIPIVISVPVDYQGDASADAKGLSVRSRSRGSVQFQISSQGRYNLTTEIPDAANPRYPWTCKIATGTLPSDSTDTNFAPLARIVREEVGQSPQSLSNRLEKGELPAGNSTEVAVNPLAADMAQ